MDAHIIYKVNGVELPSDKYAAAALKNSFCHPKNTACHPKNYVLCDCWQLPANVQAAVGKLASSCWQICQQLLAIVRNGIFSPLGRFVGVVSMVCKDGRKGRCRCVSPYI